MDESKYDYICVDIETDEAGRKRIKRGKDGSNPLEVLAKVLAEEDLEYQKTHAGDPAIKWVITKERWTKGDLPHYVFRLVSATTGDAIRKFIIKDNETDRPVPIAGKLSNGEPIMARSETVEHIGAVFDYEKVRAEAIRRGVQIQAASSWVAFDKALAEMEG